MIIPVEKLSKIELYTVVINIFFDFFPTEKPITPSVEKAYASKKNEDIIINCIKIEFIAINSSPRRELK